MPKYTLDYWGDSLLGDVAFSFTAATMKSIAHALWRYKNNNNVDLICVGYDARLLSKDLALELVDSLCDMGTSCVVIDNPSPIFLISWLITQSDKDKKSIGLYIGGDSSQIGRLFVSFRGEDGSPLSHKQTEQIHADYMYYNNSNLDFIDRRVESTLLDLREGYGKWITDTLKINPLDPVIPIGVDYLTSPVKPYLQEIAQSLNVALKPVSDSFWPPLLLSKQLRPNPSGWTLIYPYTTLGCEDINISFDGDGDCIGIYDGKSKEEISPSGVFIILLNYFKNLRKKAGTILVTKAVSRKVIRVAESFGYSIEEVKSGLDELGNTLNKKRKSPALMFGDEYGGFWFKGLPPDRQPIPSIIFILESCRKYKLSPSSLYDKIVSERLERIYASGKIDIYLDAVDEERLVDFLSTKNKEIGNRKVKEFEHNKYSSSKFFSPHVFVLEDDTRIVIQSNPKNSFIELYVESTTKELVYETISEVQRSIFFFDFIPVT